MNLNLTLNCSKECALAFRIAWKNKSILKHERFYALYLDYANHLIIKPKRLNIGDKSATLFDFETLLHYAYKTNAGFIIICHNHIDGICEPTGMDIDFTKQVKLVLDTIGIKLADHIIITPNSYYSFRDSGILVA